jgi:hypothetical protein
MWKNISTAISILCMLVYVSVTALAVYKIANAVSEHRIIAEREFAGLQDMAHGAGVLGFTGADLENEIRASVLRSLTLEAAIVTVSDGAAFAVEKPGGRAVIPLHNNTGYSFNTKWKFYRPPYSSEIRVDRITLRLDALAGYIDKIRLGDILRETLLAILLTVTAAFLVLMLDIIVFDKQKAASKASDHPHRPIPDKDGEPHDPQEPAFAEEEAEPSGTYLGLVQKLHEELAVTNEKRPEFVLLCAEWTKNGFAVPPLAKQIAEEAAVFFRVKRMSAFKRGQNGVFILLPKMLFKTGLKAAREFHGRILDHDVFKTMITNFFVGLTSRAGRQVEPERLIHEAEKAVEKAKEDVTQPIVAFKADPVKYKDYVRNKD